MVTKRMHRLDNGLLCEEAPEALDAPFASISREVLDRLPKEPLADPDRKLVRLTGSLEPRCAPITESVPDIPERPTVTVERGATPSEWSWSCTLCGACTWIVDVCIGIAFAALIVFVTTCVAVAVWWMAGRF